jgi:shikimate kinase
LFAGEKDAGTLRELMERRRPAYETADFRVPTDNRTVREIADRILSLIQRRAGPRCEGERP